MPDRPDAPHASAGQVPRILDPRYDVPLDDDELEALVGSDDGPTGEEFGLRVAPPLGDVAIRCADLGIRYNLNYTRKTKLRTTFANLLDRKQRNKGHFWALRHVDLEIRRGEAVGIIGPNGSGKSTMLLAMAGILQPTEGVVEVSGHISTMLSLNAGFDADLTGRENIALAGALMGIDQKVMRELTPGIIKFANIGAFIDAPLKTYSSGMRARVGFSIATAVDPDILLLDEVLQTGDNQFKRKSRRRITEVLRTAKAVVMVTHDMSWITAFCTRAILMDKGQIVAEGDPEEIADRHEQNARKRSKRKRKAKQLLKHGQVDIVDLKAARKAGTLDELVEGHEETLAELKTQKKHQARQSRAKRRAAKLAREAETAREAAAAAAELAETKAQEAEQARIEEVQVLAAEPGDALPAEQGGLTHEAADDLPPAAARGVPATDGETIALRPAPPATTNGHKAPSPSGVDDGTHADEGHVATVASGDGDSDPAAAETESVLTGRRVPPDA
jgi:ABC-2 type transport system ATP-binding protein